MRPLTICKTFEAQLSCLMNGNSEGFVKYQECFENVLRSFEAGR